MRRRVMAVWTAMSMAASTAMAQARPEDVASIDGIMRAYYQVVSGPAGGVVDTARDNRLHHPNAWVAIAGTDSAGKPRVRVMRLAEYHGSNAPRTEGFYEYETAREIRQSGHMVHVWSSYASARTEGGEPFARGVNSVTLFHDGTRWWIMGWMFDQSAPTGSPPPQPIPPQPGTESGKRTVSQSRG